MTLVLNGENWFAWAVAIGVIIAAVYSLAKLIVERNAAVEKNEIQKVNVSKIEAIERSNEEKFEKWKAEYCKHLEHAAIERAKRELIEWKAVYAAGIRRDAINRSRATIAGRLAENIAPYLPIFLFNPKDARFIGHPIDYIVFDGSDDDDVREIIFLEIKARGSRLSTKQRGIREAVLDGRVSWQELRVDETVLPDEVLQIEE